MSNVRYDCPEETCGTRYFGLPGGTQERCGQHHLTFVQTDDTPGSHIDHPEQYAEPSVYMQQPSSPDAVTNDGTVVGRDQGIGSPAHPLQSRDSLVDMPEGTRVEGGATIEDPNQANPMVVHGDQVDEDQVREDVRLSSPLGQPDTQSDVDPEDDPHNHDTDDGSEVVQSNNPSVDELTDDDIDGWRNAYRSSKGEEPDKRWGVARIKTELNG